LPEEFIDLLMNTVSTPLKVWRGLLREVFWLRRGAVRPIHNGIEVDREIAVAWLIERGGARLVAPDGTEERFDAGTWVFLADRRGLVQHFAPGTRLISLRFALEWPDGRPLFDRSVTVAFAAAWHPGLAASARMLLRVSHAHRLPFGPEQLTDPLRPAEFFARECAVGDWLAEVVAAFQAKQVPMNAPAGTDERVARALRLITETPWTTSLKESQLARQVGLSVSQLNKLFVSETGKTPAAWREDRRFRLVQLALLEGAGSVKAAAAEYGFKSLSHFSVWFKRHTDFTPTDYLRSGRIQATATHLRTKR
jgi:AraC-like DNA-binding protein